MFDAFPGGKNPLIREQITDVEWFVFGAVRFQSLPTS